MSNFNEMKVSLIRRLKIFLKRLFIFCILLAIGAVLYTAYRYRQELNEEIAWKKVHPGGSMQAYKKFMDSFPDGKFYDLAKDCYLEQKKIITDWNEVKNLDNPYLLADYIQKNENTPYRGLAIKKLDSLLWINVTAFKDESSLENYLRLLPQGAHSAEVSEMLRKANAIKITPDQKENCLSTIGKFYRSLQQHDETNLMRCVE